MKITHIATAAVVPAAIAGAVISFGIAGHSPAPGKTQPTAARGPAATPARDSTAQASTEQASTSAAQAGTGQARSANPSAVWVTVKRGQTLSGIASAHHMTWQAIYATPPNTRVLHNPDVLVAGERLRIPSDPKQRAAQFKARYAAKLARSTAASPAPAAPAAAQPPSTQAGGTFSAAGMSAFEQCVALRESSDTPTDPDGLFGILPATWQSLGYSGSAGQASVAVQEQAFAKLYAEDGTAPWAPYDGC
jgi:hypothetical protein